MIRKGKEDERKTKGNEKKRKEIKEMKGTERKW